MKKSLLTLATALAILAPMAVQAKGYQSVIVTKTDATVLAIQGEQGMKATTKEQTLRFVTPDESFIEIPLDEVTGWEYSQQHGDAQWTSISGAEINPNIVLTRTTTGIMLQNLPDNSSITLTALNGTVVSSLKVSGYCEIPFDSLQNGIYLLTFNNQTVKIAVSR